MFRKPFAIKSFVQINQSEVHPDTLGPTYSFLKFWHVENSGVLLKNSVLIRLLKMQSIIRRKSSKIRYNSTIKFWFRKLQLETKKQFNFLNEFYFLNLFKVDGKVQVWKDWKVLALKLIIKNLKIYAKTFLWIKKFIRYGTKWIKNKPILYQVENYFSQKSKVALPKIGYK